MPDDYSSTTQTTGAVAVGGSATGEIETSKDFDWFAVDLVAGHTYVIDLEGADSGGGALQDPVLRGLYDAAGNRIAGARDNDGGAGRDARLTFTAATTGAYYIEARGHLNQTGEYTVRVTEWVDTDAERGGADRSRRYHGSRRAAVSGSITRRLLRLGGLLALHAFGGQEGWTGFAPAGCECRPVSGGRRRQRPLQRHGGGDGERVDFADAAGRDVFRACGSAGRRRQRIQTALWGECGQSRRGGRLGAAAAGDG